MRPVVAKEDSWPVSRKGLIYLCIKKKGIPLEGGLFGVYSQSLLIAANNMIRKSLVTCLIFSIGLTVEAQTPSVSSIGGTAVHGANLTIYGNSFETKIPAAPYKWDNFQNGAAGSFLAPGNPPWLFVAKIWVNSSAVMTPQYRPAYSASYPRYPGDVTLYHQFGPKAEGYLATNELALGNLSIGRLYVYAWFRSTVSGKPARNAKVFQNAHGEWGSEYPHNTTRWDFYPVSNAGHMTSDNCPMPPSASTTHNSWTNSGPSDLGFGDSTWHSLEFWHNRGTPNGGDAEFVTRRDARFLNRIAGTFMTNDCPETWLGLMSYFDRCLDTMPENENDRTCGSDPAAYGPPYSSLDWYWGEIYVDTTQARVLICASSSWTAKENNGAHCEIQIPSAWSSNDIQVTVNQGSFAAGEQAYLYVVNASGGVNAVGFPVTIGGSSPTPTPDRIAPESPGNLRRGNG